MKKSNLLILLVAVALIGAGAVYFLTNMMGNDEAQGPDEQGFETGSQAGEPSAVPDPNDSPTATETPAADGAHDGYLDHDHAEIVMGEKAPDFTLLDMEGNQVKLSDFEGRMVFLNFWATWCTYCDIEMPDLQKVNDEHEDLVVLAVNVREDKDLVQEYLDEGGYDFPVVLDEDGHMAQIYLVSGMPTTYFISDDGKLLGYQPGMLTLEQMEDIIVQMRDLQDQL
jgi:thiol-disulfide isomerase/thioredoxin